MNPANKQKRDPLVDLAENLYRVANAITPQTVHGGTDAAGGHVTSLTEAVMGTTSGLCSISDSIDQQADSLTAVADAVSGGCRHIAEAIHELAAAVRSTGRA